MRLALLAASVPPSDGALLGPRSAFVAKFPASHGARRADVALLAPERAFAEQRRHHGHYVQPCDVLPRVDKEEENYQRFERSSYGGFDPFGRGCGGALTAHGRTHDRRIRQLAANIRADVVVVGPARGRPAYRQPILTLMVSRVHPMAGAARR